MTTSTGVILAATDLSEAGDEAIRQADRHARAHGQRLVVCHVIAQSGHAGGVLWPALNAEITRAQSEEVPVALRSVIERASRLSGREPAELEAIVVVGSPHVAIVSVAEAQGASLIILGAARAPGIAGRLLGTVAELVVRYAHCSVLVARPEAGLRILVATDLSAPSLPALTAAALEARRRGVPVTALHCVEASLPGSRPEELADVVEEARAQLISATRWSDVDVETIVHIGNPSDLIVASAIGIGADLVVVATRGRTGLRRILLGSVAETVVRRVQCSVLVVRHD